MVWPKTIKTILIIALVIRLLLLPWTFHGDITVTYWWGKFATEFTWPGFYDWLNFGGYGRPDQPMLNIYYVWAVRQVFLFLHSIFWQLNIAIPAFPSGFMQWFFLSGNQILLKVPMIIADIGLIYFVYKIIPSKKLALLLALYPPLIYNSAVWGSGDSIINLFGLLSIYFLWKKKYIFASLFFIFSVLYKSSLLIWSPIILLILIKNKVKFKNIILTALFSLGLIYLISLPFTPQGLNPIFWFVRTMTEKILPGAMPQITANAMNFWAIFLGLKPHLDEMLVFNLISFRHLSLLICFILYSFSLFRLYKNFSFRQILLSLAQISLITFTFMTRMHERYTFPALIPLLLLSYYDRSFFKYFIILTITHLLNVYNWWWVPQIPFLISFLKLDLVIRLISFINTIVTLKLLVKNAK